MNEAEAMEAVALVSRLWPSPPLDDVRGGFYARALTVIGSQRAAMDAISELFVDERFQPAPGDIIDRALGVATGAPDAWELIVAYARELDAGRQPDVALPDPVHAAMVAAGARLGQVRKVMDRPRDLDALRDRFVTAYRDTMRAAAAGELQGADTKELTT
jgi:hypothetical protein